MSKTLRAVILVDSEQAELLSADILSAPLYEHIARALSGAGVTSVTVAGASFFPGVSSGFDSFTQLGTAGAAAADIRGGNAELTYVFAAPSLVDAAALSELRVTAAAAMSATVLMADGRPLIYALPEVCGDDVIAESLGGGTDGFCIWDIAGSAGIALPVTSYADLARAEEALRDKINGGHIRAGVRMTGMSTIWISPDAKISNGATILPGTIIRGATRVGAGCVIGPNTLLDGATIGDNTTVNSSQVVESSVGRDTAVGPFAYIRMHSVVGDGCRVGDFVEIKNSNIGNRTKMAHLAYIGDADLGCAVNIGCGVITANYDGVYKHRTVIHDEVFVGSNANLVAPVEIEANAYVAAGTTVTQTVPSGHLAIGRARQENKPGWAERVAKMKAQKAAK